MATQTPPKAAPSSQQPSHKRPIPLIKRPDLIHKRIDYRGEPHFVTKDPVGLQYHRLRPEQWAVLELLDGERNLETIRKELKLQYPGVSPSLSDIQELIQDLHVKNLVLSARQGQGTELLGREIKERKKKFISTLKNIMYLRLPGWDPEATLARYYPMVRWLFHPWAVSLCMLFVVSAWMLVLIRFDTFQRKLPEFQQFFGWPNLMWMWLTLAIAKVIHEFGHGFACKHFGGECHEMGMMLLVFSPCLYCDVTDSWMLRSKWKRIAIGGAGMYIEVILSAAAIFLWWNTQPGLINFLCLNVFFVTTVTTVIFNANPLMRFDGYYMMSDFLEVPNLRTKADSMLRNAFAKTCFGIESRPNPFLPETGRFWMMLYAICAFCYRWLIVFGIAMFLYTVLKPYGLQSIGATMAVVSLGGFLYSLVSGLVKILRQPRREPLSRVRLTITLTVLAAVIIGGLFIPLPWHVESPLYLQPDDVRHVYLTTPGFVESVHVKPGDDVKAGTVLAVLQNPELEDKHESLLGQIHQMEVRLKSLRGAEQFAEINTTKQQLAGFKEDLQEIERQISELTVKAPVAGRIVAPPRNPELKRDTARNVLARWNGTPLEERNRELWLDMQTHFADIAPKAEMEAVIYVDQANRQDIAPGQPVEIQFDHLPGRTFKGAVRSISARHLEFVPPSLSNKYGGPLSTVTDGEGQERVATPIYQAAVKIEDDLHLLRTGVRGHARVLVDRRTPADWIWRWLRRTFYFRL